MAKLKLVNSKIRRDALAMPPNDYDHKGRHISLEESLHQKLARLKQININEEPFTYSLKKVHERSFISKLLPSIMIQ